MEVHTGDASDARWLDDVIDERRLTHVYTFALQAGWRLHVPVTRVAVQHGALLLTVREIARKAGLHHRLLRDGGAVARTTGGSRFTLLALKMSQLLPGRCTEGERVCARQPAETHARRARAACDVHRDPTDHMWCPATLVRVRGCSAHVWYDDGDEGYVPLWWVVHAPQSV